MLDTIQLPNNDILYKRLNLYKWYEQGYYGEGTIYGTSERWDLKDYSQEALATEPKFTHIPGRPLHLIPQSLHGEQTARVFHQIAPKAQLVMIPTYRDESWDIDGFKDYGMPYIQENGLLGMFDSTSIATKQSSALGDQLDLVKDCFSYYTSAGNHYTNDEGNYNYRMEDPRVIGVGAANLDPSRLSRTEPFDFSSNYEGLDFSAPGEIYINDDSSDSVSPIYGTSVSAPVLCGMSALVNEFFIKKVGVPLSRKMMYKFFQDNSYDLLDIGHDDKTGYGMVILPNPEDIIVNDYLVDKEFYQDWGQISDWAKIPVQRMAEKGILIGDERGFRPQDSITREEFAVILNRIN